MGTELTPSPEVTLLKSEMEAAAARVAERAMNTTIDGVSGILGDLFGGWFGDGLKQWRTRRLVDTLIKTKDHLEAAGIPIENAKSLPMGELYAIFEGCSKQEDASLADMWSALLANAMNPNNEKYIDPSFSRILGNLSGLDAVILNYMKEYEENLTEIQQKHRELSSEYRKVGKPNSESAKVFQHKISDLDKEFSKLTSGIYKSKFDGFSEENISYSISNLLRTGLIYLPEDRIPEPLIQVGLLGGSRGQLVADDRGLRLYLKQMRDLAGDAIEKRSTLQKLVIDGNSDWRYAAPIYSLSGLAKRFLAACSANR
ncbi:conserved hypothetical protein [Mesorhizobium sp. ORS 3324]|nr:conserved hypothetical protein [Mesorhizobium sp. ORS 3324]